MSRLIVKGLPKRYDERLLRELFCSCGDVTDAKVIRTPDGRSRQFGFVGFKNADEGQRARQMLNRTYVDSSQVSVEVARPVGDSQLPRPWSRYSQGSSLHDKQRKITESKAPDSLNEVHLFSHREKLECHPEDNASANANGKSSYIDRKGPEYDEFRDVTRKRSKTPLWANGSLTTKNKINKSQVQSRKTGGAGLMLEKCHVVFDDDEDDDDDDDEDDDDLYQDLHGKSDYELTRNLENELERHENRELEKNSNSLACDGDVDDMHYLKSKVQYNFESDSECSLGNESDRSSSRETQKNSDACGEADSEIGHVGTDSHFGAGDDDTKAVALCDGAEHVENKRKVVGQQYDAADNAVDASETGRIFIRNLSYSVTEDDLETLLEPFGTISDIHIVQDARTKQSRGVAFASFVVPENAVKAMSAVDGSIFFGRLIHILPGRQRNDVSIGNKRPRSSVPGSNTFKEIREEARKESAKTGADFASYNALFMSSDAVAEVMADRLGLTKSDIYGAGRGESGSAAVRLAAGEAKLHAETRDYLSANGIDIDLAFSSSRSSQRKKMSRVAFLVKNLPARTSEDTLYQMFAKFGLLSRILVVPSGLLAVVVYGSANDAKNAYKSLAYTRMKGTPLYLEWLPNDAVENINELQDEQCKSQVRNELPDNIQLEPLVKPQEDQSETVDTSLIDSVPQLSVFVKNLNFDTNEEGLRKHFSRLLRKRGKVALAIRAVSIATRANPKDASGPRLSYGYGFVEFSTCAFAEEAMKAVQGSSLDGHILELRIAHRTGLKDADRTTRERVSAGRSASKRKPTAKLVVRNIAFEATSRDLRHLFGTFGHVQSIRMPRKHDGSHRGFGFVQFISKNEAIAALNSLSAAHLYGRHLVIDYADESTNNLGSLEEMQAKAAEQVSKRRKLDGELSTIAGTEGDFDDDHLTIMDEIYA